MSLSSLFRCSRSLLSFRPLTLQVNHINQKNWSRLTTRPLECLQAWRSFSVDKTDQPSIAQRVTPYIKLMRLDRPTGAMLLLWPSCWGIALATSPGCLPSLYYLSLFTTGAILMRGAGCVVNDLWDKDIDARVQRTKDRPLASGQISTKNAIRFLAGQLGASAVILFSFDLNSIILGASSLILVGTYPVFKRITHWPQVVLGLTFNWGVLLGYSVISGGTLYPLETVIPLYVAGICWTVIYDTIYAHQDKVDDLRIGIKSTAIKFGDKTKPWLAGFSVAMTTSLLITGVTSGQLWPYYLSVAGIGSHLAYQLNTLDINDSAKCWSLFKKNTHIGVILFLGLVMSTFLKDVQMDETTTDQQDETINDHREGDLN